jgi:SAM-dependent methyltransferase
MLCDDPEPTLWVAQASLKAARQAGQRPQNDMFLDTLGLSESERDAIGRLPMGPVDPVVSMLVPATSGHLYFARQGKYGSYPIPELRLPDSHGERFLELGCSWGRWCVAAARKGYRVVGIDPSLGAVLAAKRVMLANGVTADFVVADARRLPFAANSQDLVFSYSVLQHFGRADVARTLAEVSRVLTRGGRSMIQMPNAIGIRSLYHQARRGFAEATAFEVRYWRINELRTVFEQLIGPSTVSVDGFFGLGIQGTDAEHMSPAHRVVCRASDFLRRLSRTVSSLTQLADSVYVASTPRDS